MHAWSTTAYSIAAGPYFRGRRPGLDSGTVLSRHRCHGEGYHTSRFRSPGLLQVFCNSLLSPTTMMNAGNLMMTMILHARNCFLNKHDANMWLEHWIIGFFIWFGWAGQHDSLSGPRRRSQFLSIPHNCRAAPFLPYKASFLFLCFLPPFRNVSTSSFSLISQSTIIRLEKCILERVVGLQLG